MSADEEQTIYDITVIGGGPVGMYGLYYAGMRDMRAKVIESLPQLGGQLAALYPEKYMAPLCPASWISPSSTSWRDGECITSCATRRPFATRRC